MLQLEFLYVVYTPKTPILLVFLGSVIKRVIKGVIKCVIKHSIKGFAAGGLAPLHPLLSGLKGLSR